MELGEIYFLSGLLVAQLTPEEIKDQKNGLALSSLSFPGFLSVSDHEQSLATQLLIENYTGPHQTLPSL